MFRNMDLMLAARREDLAGVRELIENVDDINFRDMHSFTALHYAAESGNCEMVTLLLDEGANIELRTSTGLTALHFATRNGWDNVVLRLLEYNANVDVLDDMNYTPLHYAALTIQSENVLRTLIDRARNVNSQCEMGTRPIQRAVQGNNECMVRLLVNSGANVHVKNEITGVSLLWESCMGSNVAIIKSLLDGGANPNVVESNGSTVLHYVLEKSEPEVIQMMFDHGASLDTKSSKQLSVLHSAVQNEYLSIVKMLVTMGADLTARTISGTSVLKMALSSTHVPKSYAIVEYLLWKGASLNTDLLDWSVTKRPFSEFEKKEFVIVKHMALRERMNQLESHYRSSIQSNIDLLQFYIDCDVEITRLKTIQVNDGRSLLDVLLTKEPDEILDYVQGCDITDAFDRFKFPLYSRTFSVIFSGDLNNMLSVRNAQEYVRLIGNLNSTRHLVVEKILSFLSVDILTNLFAYSDNLMQDTTL